MLFVVIIQIGIGFTHHKPLNYAEHMHWVLFPFYMQLHQKQKELFILPFSEWWNKMLPMHLVQQKRGTGRILASPVNLKRQSTPKSLFIKHNTIIILHCNEDAQIKGEENQWPHHLKCEIFSSNCLCVHIYNCALFGMNCCFKRWRNLRATHTPAHSFNHRL